MSNSLIDIKKIAVVQSNKIIIQNVSFQLFAGDFTFLIGKVGSGKTSLIKTLYAELPLLIGNAEIDNFNLMNIKNKEIPFLRRKLGIVFQDFKLLTDRNIHDNLKFVLEATGWTDKNKISDRINEVLTEVDLSEKEYKMPNELSGGEQQRIVIARAILNKPPIIIADEPTGNLDPESSLKIMEILNNLANSGSCVIIATHQYNLIKKYPGRILKIEKGALSEINYEEVDDLIWA
ncbi:MAG: ATP-binding cassette domain-containing protein [Bacteroidales bacterium]|nr:ATP-binding cassette domain-containing protein [Bacteroidales bacterium]MBN2757311.1 ATP-binding cassette domain-containing protein [Bacteroidales bacterium]